MQGPAIFIDLTLEDQVIARVFDKIVCVNVVILLKICEKNELCVVTHVSDEVISVKQYFSFL